MDVDNVLGYQISIHAPRAGSDITDITFMQYLILFQSTPPVRGATSAFGGDSVVQRISIHAPRAGSDPDRQ